VHTFPRAKQVRSLKKILFLLPCNFEEFSYSVLMLEIVVPIRLFLKIPTSIRSRLKLLGKFHQLPWRFCTIVLL
jgi:hypothetical protein